MHSSISWTDTVGYRCIASSSGLQMKAPLGSQMHIATISGVKANWGSRRALGEAK